MHPGGEHQAREHPGEVTGVVLQGDILAQGKEGEAAHVGLHVQLRVAGILPEEGGLSEHGVEDSELRDNTHNMCTSNEHVPRSRAHVHSNEGQAKSSLQG